MNPLLCSVSFSPSDDVARREARDLGDLRALAPTATETERTARWLIEEEVISRGHYPRLFDLLQTLEHHDLVPRIKALAE